MAQTIRKSTTKREKSNFTSGIVHIQSTFNNTIVTITNVSSFFSIAGLCDYSASKFAVIGFEETLRYNLINLGKLGVNTTLICTYYLKSTFNSFAEQKRFLKYIEPEELCETIIEAILTNQRVVFLPNCIAVLCFLKRLFFFITNFEDKKLKQLI